MIRTTSAFLAVLLLTAAAHPDTPPSPAADAHALPFSHARSDSRFLKSVAPSGTPVALACCKVCTVGKACGNT